MCGICGTVGMADDAVVKRMMQTMRHRGPDDEGFYTDGSAALGMRRLSIIDPAGGRQPMTDERQRDWLVFNGEIYNHAALRQELEAAGHRLATRSDTEVIVHLYEDHHERCVEYLEGDFAFAIWDTERRQLLLARDRLGVKPLYYWHQGRQFAFASELKALLCLPQVSRDLDLNALDAYLTFLYVPAPLSIFRAIRKLPPACSLILKDGAVRIRRYWDLESKSRAPALPRTEWKTAIVERLREAVRVRLMSDVPLGAFLSGGIDSSCVVAFMSQAAGRPVKTFSIGFERPYDSYNELPSARIAAKAFGTDHQELIVKPDIATLLPQAVWHLDEPFADSSSLLTFLISREAKRTVSVALTGIGGDELFGGYPRYLGAWASLSYERLPMWMRAGAAAMTRALPESTKSRNAAGWLKRFADGGCVSRERRYLQWVSYFHPPLTQDLYTAHVRAALSGSDPYAAHEAILTGTPGDYLDRMSRLDLATYLPDDLLAMGDKMSMAHGLEVRVPFCDHRLVELAASIPLRERMRGFRLKALLKEAISPFLPPALLHKPKHGFMVPIGQWLKGDLQPLCAQLLAEGVVRKRGLFSPRAVEALVRRHAQGAANLTHHVYALLVLELWCQQYLDRTVG